MFTLSNSDIREHSSLRALHPSSHSLPEHNSSHKGCSGDKVRKVTPKMVSGLVVNAPITDEESATWKSIWAPLERPIQFLCIALTFSGNEIFSSSSSNSSEYSVILTNHCAMSLWTTSNPHLQHLLFLTCSLARTVSQSMHQFTGADFRSIRPISLRIRNISWFQR